MSTLIEGFKVRGFDYSIVGEDARPSEKYKSALYLCSESIDGVGVVDGFSAITAGFEYSKHVPFDPSEKKYHGSEYDAILAYNEFSVAIDSLPKPLCIICKSNRRAGAVLMAYTAAKEGLSTSELDTMAEGKQLSYLGNPVLNTWVHTVAQNYSKRSSCLVRQMFEKESSTYTYLLADSLSKEAILIDPVIETVARDSALVSELGLTLKYVINTHVHADHITGSGKLKELHPGCLSAISVASQASADVKLAEHDSLSFGNRKIFTLATPGHTEGCVSYVMDDLSKVFTGDALLVRGCGRTDFQGGSAAMLYDSVHSRLLSLPATCVVYPAHDYKGHTSSTIGEEIQLNPRLSQSKEDFISIMDNLNLPRPKKMDDAVPANLVCGE